MKVCAEARAMVVVISGMKKCIISIFELVSLCNDIGKESRQRLICLRREKI